MGQQVKHLMDEADIGSGDKSPGQVDVERDEQSLGRGPDGDGQQGRVLQSGTHLARIVAVAQPDGLFEAQVYVRLTREPEVAETYIPAGTYPTEAEAWAAAEERAQRAFNEHEF
ncbi:hypothetical protein [Noviherbaspirillum sp.]|uniref:hypothetical protein n=1 Tax=Noviherbaspirillum sp. TaxID=1926288 RepID=UPI002D715D5B|nr:hypothetical protein [Noviherbaspirillum sp.]HZW21497.1 hypothetical protein [Noviherbaspirillum sp.]